MRTLPRRSPGRAGFTLVEVMVATVVLSILMGSMLVTMQQEARGLGEMADVQAKERSVRNMIGRLETLLEFAAGATPQGFLTRALEANEGVALDVDSHQGFPPEGILLLEPGTEREERLGYSELLGVGPQLGTLTRGVQCTFPERHPEGTAVHWAEMAVAIENQVDPTEDLYEGQVLGTLGSTFFRGDGTGFSFRVPTDPEGGSDFFHPGGIRWGSTVEGVPTTDGWSALRYVPFQELREAVRDQDLNGDGDAEDVFDVGHVELVTWYGSGMNPSTTRTRLCPPIVLQERCNWGGDLDGDGFADPLFLWIPDEGRLELHLRLSLGALNEREVVRDATATLHLRNGRLQ